MPPAAALLEAPRFLAAVGAELPSTILAPQQDLDTLDDLRALMREPAKSLAQQRLWALVGNMQRMVPVPA